MSGALNRDDDTHDYTSSVTPFALPGKVEAKKRPANRSFDDFVSHNTLVHPKAIWPDTETLLIKQNAINS